MRVGQPYSITWTGHWERGDEVFSINTFPTNSDVYGTIATVSSSQASCSGNGMGHWAAPVTCHYIWTPTYSTPSLRIGILTAIMEMTLGTPAHFLLHNKFYEK